MSGGENDRWNKRNYWVQAEAQIGSAVVRCYEK